MEINPKKVLREMFINYFLENKESDFTESQLILKEIATILGEDAIYGSIKNGEKYLISAINNYSEKLYLGQMIVAYLYNLIEFEQNLIKQNNLKKDQYNLYLNKLSKVNKNERASIKLDTKERILINKSLRNCDYFLSENEEVEFHDKTYKTKDLNDFQKLAIVFEMTDEYGKYCQRRCEFYRQTINRLIMKNLLSSDKELKKVQTR